MEAVAVQLQHHVIGAAVNERDSGGIINTSNSSSRGWSSWDEQIYWQSDGVTAHEPIRRDDIKLFVFNCLCLGIGLPVNVYTALLVVNSKRPRHVLLLSAILCCIAVLLSTDLVAIV